MCKHEESKFVVAYLNHKGDVSNFLACALCDLCKEWPNWRRGLRFRIEK